VYDQHAVQATAETTTTLNRPARRGQKGSNSHADNIIFSRPSVRKHVATNEVNGPGGAGPGVIG